MRMGVLLCLVCAISSANAQTTAGGFVPPVSISGTAASLLNMKGIAVDAAGDVYFAAGGYYSYTVLRWDAGTGILTNVAGNGTPGFTGDNGPATSAQLDGVNDIALDAAGDLYIADANNGRVRKVSNGIITTVAGGGTSQPCDGCAATSVNLYFLTGIATDSTGNLYVFNGGFVFKSSNGVLANVLGSATFSNSSNIPPAAAAMDSAGNLYIADLGFNQIRKIANGTITTVAGTGVPGFNGDGGPATSAQLTGPRGVAVDAAGDLYISDTGNQRIRKVSNGAITTVAGGGPAVPGLGDNGPATAALLNYPFGVAVDRAGNIYIEDALNHRIRKIANGVITTVAGGGSTPVLTARSAGTFATTGSMSVGRQGSTATLLDNGRVLVAGGWVSPNYTASAELYDPATGSFSPTGGMTSTLAATIATLLADGRVLIVGTTDPNNTSALAGTQLYDPATGTFFSGPSALNISRPVTATLLNNGKVLITGGSGPLPTAVTDYAAELYDPLTGVFTSAGEMSWAHSSPTATLLADGRVLFAEGHCPGLDLRGNELYDPVTGAFTAIAETQSCLSGGPSAVLLANGQVLIGGSIYDPSSGTFTSAPEVVEWGNTRTLLGDGTVLVAGGEPPLCYTLYLCGDFDVPDAYLRDPASGNFGFTGLMAFPRYGAQGTYLPDGTVLISGGIDLPVNDPNLATVELYRPVALTAAPSLFSTSGDANGQGAIWHATGEITSPQNPAVSGEILSMYTTSLIQGGVIPPRVIMGGRLAEIVYFGAAPGYPGYYQLNFRVPEGVAGSAVPLKLRYLDRPSNGVTITIASR